MHPKIKSIYLRYFFKFKKNVRFSKGSRISSETLLEGNNSLGANSSSYGCVIGYGTYIGKNTHLNRAKLGRYCSIASNVSNITGRHPITTFVSTHPCFFSTGKAAGFTFTKTQKFDEIKYTSSDKKFINEIGNDVWIGENVIIMDGIKIGDGAVIGACSLVTKDIEPYSINIGIPAKLVKYRFQPEQIDFLLKEKWWDKNIEWIKNNIDLFHDIENYIKHV
jgi:acetyltransferase-like isoleucine patch superfamily enzyme